ncbi:putative DNA modification/repair radical SAM protein [bacterium]|nr:putative DNA modification/repair radical SAM protein [bacterium]
MNLTDKIGVLADAAKYDASCSTAGSARKNAPGGLGNGAVGGICHAWAADGRCVALLKVLLSNACAYDCAYCVNRRSNDVRRASFEPEELVRLIVDFYRRNYIEGVFLSSGVIGCPDATMERLLAVARTLRTRERFNGYIHLKIIPGASERLTLEAARWADRVSVNIELPSAASLARVAPDKKPQAIFGPMRVLAAASGFEAPRLAAPRQAPAAALGSGGAPGAALPERRSGSDTPGKADDSAAPPGEAWPMPVPAGKASPAGGAARRSPSPMMDSQATQALPSVWEARKTRARNPEAPLIPAGQTTQMVVGASPESDASILTLAENLYLAYDVRRVYYSAFVPTGSDPRLPAVNAPPLAREHRLYQADWLFRFYGFKASEILDPTRPFLDSRLDPKSDWALRHLEFFPIELETAEYGELLRVPGIGPISAAKIVKARRQSPLRAAALPKLGVVARRAKWFITVGGKLPDTGVPERGPWMLDNPDALRGELLDPAFRAEPSAQPELPWENAR